jgi:hypothetical protein
MKTHIEDNDLDDKVKLLLSVHDQQVSVREDYAAQWAITQNRANGKAAMYVPSGALKTESDIMDHWTKDK